MPLGEQTRVSSRNHVLDGGSDAPWELAHGGHRYTYRVPRPVETYHIISAVPCCFVCIVSCRRVDSDERHVTSDKGDGLSSSVKTLSGSVSPRSVLDMATIRYDTRCYINVRSKANMSQLNLPHATDN